MHHIRLHLGDYARDAGHLTLAEHGAYLRLLMAYYAHERPLPADVAKCARLAGARSDDDLAAVATVLEEFFSVGPRGWVHRRVERELEAYRGRVTTARANGAKGGRPRKSTPGKAGTPGEAPSASSSPAPAPVTPEPMETDLTLNPLTPSGDGPPLALVGAPGSLSAVDVAKAMRAAGVQAQPGHPRILALVASGLTQAELDAALADYPGKPCGYICAAIEGRRRDAQAAPAAPKTTSRHPRSAMSVLEALAAIPTEGVHGHQGAHREHPHLAGRGEARDGDPDREPAAIRAAG